MMPDISGPSSPVSSPPASLQSSLESRLRARLEGLGSEAYSLTWKQWPIEGQEPICALRASGRTTSAKGSTGWPTQITNDSLGSTHCYGKKREDGSRDIFLKLPVAANTVGWPTPQAGDEKWRCSTAAAAADRRVESGKQVSLEVAAHITGWSTPRTSDQHTETLAAAEKEKTRVHAGGGSKLALDVHETHGSTPNPSSAETVNTAAFQLNPRFSLWLMGYPSSWTDVAHRAQQSLKAAAMPSFRKSRQSSSAPTLKS